MSDNNGGIIAVAERAVWSPRKRLRLAMGENSAGGGGGVRVGVEDKKERDHPGYNAKAPG